MADVRWLNEKEREAWLRLAGVSFLLPAVLDSQLQRDAGISTFEYIAMAMLSEEPDRTLQLKSLAVLTNGSLSRLSHVVTRLENRGWVRRMPSDRDGRITVAWLTDAGYAKVVATAPGHVETVRSSVFDALTPEQVDQLAGIMGAIQERLDAARRCPPGVAAPVSP